MEVKDYEGIVFSLFDDSCRNHYVDYRSIGENRKKVFSAKLKG